MARVVVYAMAYRGDVYPYVPIASVLARRGHDVVFVAPREYHAQFVDEPFACLHSGTDFAPVSLDRHAQYLARCGMRLRSAPLLRLLVSKFVVPNLPVLYRTIDQALVGADILVAHPVAALVGGMAAERQGIPWVVGDLFPMQLRADARTSVPTGGSTARTRRAVSGRARASIIQHSIGGEAILAFRRRLGLPTKAWNVVDGWISPTLNVGLVSPTYIERRAEWPVNYRLTGFTNWVGPNSGRLDNEITAYLDRGTRPVLVTMGTSAASAHPDVFGAVGRALDRREIPGVFLVSNADIAARLRSELTNPAHGIWSFAPIASVLPYCRAAVHSGAHGTNAATLAAGLPSALIPALFDQRWRAQRQRALGLSAWVRRRSDLDPAIDAILGSAMTERAVAYGDLIHHEDGAATAADEIEWVLAGGCRKT